MLGALRRSTRELSVGTLGHWGTGAKARKAPKHVGGTKVPAIRAKVLAATRAPLPSPPRVQAGDLHHPGESLRPAPPNLWDNPSHYQCYFHTNGLTRLTLREFRTPKCSQRFTSPKHQHLASAPLPRLLSDSASLHTGPPQAPPSPAQVATTIWKTLCSACHRVTAAGDIDLHFPEGSKVSSPSRQLQITLKNNPKSP